MSAANRELNKRLERQKSGKQQEEKPANQFVGSSKIEKQHHHSNVQHEDSARREDEFVKSSRPSTSSQPHSRANQHPDQISAEEKEKLESWIGERWTGRSDWFNVRKGFGFVTSTMEGERGGRKVFIHYKNISEQQFKSIKDNEDVEFTVQYNEKGLCATNLTGIGGSALQGHVVRPIISKNKKNLIKWVLWFM
ncbi:unnamed protein product [Bursaphelenchus okinawaensis]|uniref:CSD domain-containing protein n=1 Tax=Bursaphelenchus okinawaensis TaxID=465554 RepID=A0A811JY09_9BILA|nr:unnamed protein product [Bursaphelenchus okinawaensis]CAG9086796.1 unnamed protein product [Bursaphelenchus okinawaensis]